jgi:hypothetical protein
MIKRITILLLLLTSLVKAQTVLETLLLGLGNAIAQNGIPTSYVAPKFHKGFIVLNTDTLKGQIKVRGNKVCFFNDSIERIIKMKNKPLIRKVASIIFFPFINNDPKRNFIKANRINSVRLFASDTLLTRNNYMDFIHIANSSVLYRRIYSGSIEIFDRNYNTDENPGYVADELIVMDNGKRISDVPNYSIPKKYLVECINKKFNKDFKTSDFRSKIDVIYWLYRNDTNLVDH